jgi:pseudouridine kinase
VCVIGGINLDIKGVSYSQNNLNDSNIGKTFFTPGGVARNISENLAKLGVSVHLLGCVGNDVNGKLVTEETKKSGVHTDRILISDKIKTSTYISVSDSSGNLISAVNDMSDSINQISEDYIKENTKLFESGKLIIIDTNLNENIIEAVIRIACNKNIPVFIDTVSTAKSNVIKKLTQRINYLSPNLEEYKNIFGVFDMDVIHQRLETNSFKNFDFVIVKRGEAGVSLIDVHNKKIKLFNPIKLEAVEPNGAGDAFNAGFIFGVINNYDIFDSVQLGISAAYFALKSVKSVPEDLTKENLLKIFNRKVEFDNERF